MKTNNKYIDFTYHQEHEIMLEQSAKRFVLDNIEIDPDIELNIITINIEFIYINNEKLFYPISVKINKHENTKDIYIPNYSFNMNKVSKLRIYSNLKMPVKLFYNFERILTQNVYGE